jgi:glycosyltransferase involved in cell wall biosynthesis
MHISVVIITKNEAHIIGDTLKNIREITDDIVIVDSGSKDDTINICKQFNCNIISVDWKGYGETKNIGNAVTKHDWILSLDADESLDDVLKSSVAAIGSPEENHVFKFNRKNFFCKKLIRYGEWGNDKHIRLFNRKFANWNYAPVHENLVYFEEAKIISLKGNILHYPVNSAEEYIDKMMRYAKLNAKKYLEKGKRSTAIKLFLSPVFTFIKNYIFRLGFLDGWYGFFIAKTSAWYTFLKYSYLKELLKNKK